jgi:transcription initiation factor IIE alpha subunit
MMGQQLFRKQLEHSSLGQRCCHSRCQLEHSMMGQQLFHKRLEHSSLGQHCSRCHSRYQLEQSSLGQLCSRCRTRLLVHCM